MRIIINFKESDKVYLRVNEEAWLSQSSSGVDFWTLLLFFLESVFSWGTVKYVLLGTDSIVVFLVVLDV